MTALASRSNSGNNSGHSEAQRHRRVCSAINPVRTRTASERDAPTDNRHRMPTISRARIHDAIRAFSKGNAKANARRKLSANRNARGQTVTALILRTTTCRSMNDEYSAESARRRERTIITLPYHRVRRITPRRRVITSPIPARLGSATPTANASLPCATAIFSITRRVGRKSITGRCFYFQSGRLFPAGTLSSRTYFLNIESIAI